MAHDYQELYYTTVGQRQGPAGFQESGIPVALKAAESWGSRHQRVAIRWSEVLGTKVSPAQVIVCLIDLKVAGLAHDPRHLDSITDIAGYADILAEVLSNA